MSGILEFLSNLLRFFSELFSRKREERETLWEEIQDTRNKLVLALEEGRLTDVAVLRRRLDQLMEEYSKYTKSMERKMRRGVSPLHAVLLASVLMTGCMTAKSKPSDVVLVNGDRVLLLNPGQEIVVPDLIPPAKRWYLMDNVGMQHLLGIPVDFGKKDVE